MLQCGLLVPMKQTSECCLFDNLFIDIGDEQSLENDLSTYSSHLLSMKHLCRVANDACLFLIDECGTGTDPNIGGAIAEAVLEHLNDKNAFGIVTTHYSNLKLLSEKHSAISNAAMLFDTKALKPLYRLSVGNPGSSFAFEIAQTIGLPSEIIESAKTKVGSGMVDFEQSLQTLAVEKMEIKSKQTELQLADDLLNSLVEQYKAKKEEITRKEKEIIFEAKKQANQILKDANKQIEETIRNIKTTKAEKVSTQKEREKIKESIKKVEEESKALQSEISNIEPPKKETKKHIPFDNSPLQEGDIVLVDGQDSYGMVLKLKKNKAEVVCGQMSLSLPIERLQKVNKNSYLKQQKQQSGAKSRISISLMQDINDLRAKFDYRLDLRGRRADEALSELSKYIDTARLLGESEIAILHGKGDGILKTVLRDYLKENPEVDSFKAERVEFGGEGITKIKLK
jgi:DNA mismatch repair protein MutS2